MRGNKRYFYCHLMPRIATLFFLRKWDEKERDYFLTTRYSVPNLVLWFFNPSIFWSSLPNFCILETWREEPNFCFKMSKMAAAIRYSPISGVLAGSKTCRKHCLIGEICSNFLSIDSCNGKLHASAKLLIWCYLWLLIVLLFGCNWRPEVCSQVSGILTRGFAQFYPRRWALFPGGVG